MKKFLYSLIIILILFSSVGVMWPTYAYAQPCEIKGETKIKQPDGTFVCGVPPSDGIGELVAEKAGDIWFAIKHGIALTMLGLTGSVLFIAGVLLNFSIEYTIVDMSRFVKSMVAIDAGWAVFRDLANIFFIFILIYISVSTILGISSRATKETLGKVVVVALLINFSLFFTKVIIDTSNIVTIQFYNSTVLNKNADSGLSWTFMKPLFLASFFKVKDENAPSGFNNLEVKLPDLPEDKDKQAIFTIGVMGSIFFIITAFVFLAAAIMLVTRFAILIFLMVISPLAYVGVILPKGSGMSKKWWDSLIDQCVFAPVLMMFLWFTSSLINSPAYQDLIGGGELAGKSLSSAASGDTGSVAVVMNFLILIAFLITSLVAAKKAGAAGSGFATKLAAGATIGAAALAGRYGVGRLANKFANSKVMQTMPLKGGALGLYGKALKASAEKVAGGSFDLRKAGFGGATLGGLVKDAGLNLGDIGKGKGGYAGALIRQTTKDAKNVKSYFDEGGEPIFHNESAKKEYENIQSRIKESRKNISDTENTPGGEQVKRHEEAKIAKAEAEIKEMEGSGKVITNKEVYATNLEKKPAISLQNLGRKVFGKTLKVPPKRAEVAAILRGKKPEEESKEKDDSKKDRDDDISNEIHDLRDELRRLKDKS